MLDPKGQRKSFTEKKNISKSMAIQCQWAKIKEFLCQNFEFESKEFQAISIKIKP